MTQTRKVNPLLRPLIGGSIIIGYILTMLLMAEFINNFAIKTAMNGVMGLGMGYALQRAFFGFAGTVARTGKGNPKLAYAVLTMFGIVAIVVAMLAASGNEIFVGAVDNNARTIGLGTVLGAAIFGAGMIMARACASGALTDASGGTARIMIILVFFVLGAGPGQMAQETMSHDLGTGGKINSLAAYLSGNTAGRGATATALGYFGAALLTLLFLFTTGLVAYLVAKKIRETRNIELSTLEMAMNETPDVFEEWLQKSGIVLTEKDNTTFGRTWRWTIYYNMFVKKMSLWAGAIAFGGLLIAFIVMNGKGWGVTTSFAKMFAWVFNVKESNAGFEPGKLGTPLSDGGTWRNLGLLLGAVAYMLQANKFKFTKDWYGFKNKKTWISYGVGALAGFMLGFGARLADGCNAGQWSTGVTTFSLSGWIFGIFMIGGGALAVWLTLIINKKYNN